MQKVSFCKITHVHVKYGNVFNRNNYVTYTSQKRLSQEKRTEQNAALIN